MPPPKKTEVTLQGGQGRGCRRLLKGPVPPGPQGGHPPLHMAEAQQGLCLPHQTGAHGRLIHSWHHVLVEATVGAVLAAVGPLRAQGVCGARGCPTAGSRPRTQHRPPVPTTHTPGCCSLHTQSLQRPNVRVAVAPHEHQQHQPAAATSGSPSVAEPRSPRIRAPYAPTPASPRSRARREPLSRAPPVQGRARRASRPISVPQRSPSRVAAPPRAPHGGPAPPSPRAAAPPPVPPRARGSVFRRPPRLI